MTQSVGDVIWRAYRSVTVQLYLRTGRPAEIRNLIYQTFIISDLVYMYIISTNINYYLHCLLLSHISRGFILINDISVLKITNSTSHLK